MTHTHGNMLVQSSNSMAHLFLLILLLPSSISTSVHACYETERSSLLSFGRTLSSPPLNWTTANCCRWKGITCNQDGSVTHLHLPSEGLKGGTFSSFSSLGNLTNLILLNLSHNSLYGSFKPEFFSSFSRLRILDLSYNLLSGQLPAFSPPSHNIQTLDLSSNQFHGALPSTVFHQAWNLTSFNVSNNTFSGSIPSPFCLSSSPIIRLLDFSANKFSGNIAPGLGDCSKLKVFRAGRNNLSGFLPEDVYTAAKLEEISLASNSIYGPFTDKIGNLTNLKILDLSFNPFGGVLPIQFGKLSKLKLLVLDFSNLQGSLPPSFMNCSSLVEIHMAENNLEGDISELNFSKLSHLTKLDFTSNHFSGTLPTSLFSCLSLKAIRLTSNNISGQIQPDILSLESLSFVSLDGLTNMTGALKLFMGCKSLRTLLLSDSFKGEAMPDDDAMVGFDGFRNLRFLCFYNCEFTGQIPAWFSKLKNLQILVIKGSRITGAIPNLLGTLPKLFCIGLSNNQLSGEFPKDLCGLPGLVHDDPTAVLEDDDYLELPSVMNIFYPRKLSNFPPMIDLSCNLISGKLPIEIGQMRFLHKLDLNDNNFTGPIPAQISNLKSLENLTLDMNHFSGKIPESLASLNFLKFFNVSYNDLEGPIPTGTQLQSFDASAFEGNPKLCGPPLHNKCLPMKGVDGDGKRNEDVDNGHEIIWFYTSVAVGFAIGFWGVCGTLIFKKRWRYACFQFLYNVRDRLCR